MIERPDSYIWNTLTPHCIIGTMGGRQGAGQTMPEDNLLCFTCGWMTTSMYHEHIVTIVDDYIRDVI